MREGGSQADQARWAHGQKRLNKREAEREDAQIDAEKPEEKQRVKWDHHTRK